jgi:hypothetical protein
MAETLAVSIYADIQITQQLADDLQSATFSTAARPAITLASGTGASQADTSFSDSFNVPGLGTRLIDLQSFPVAPLNNRAISFAKVKAMLFSVTSATPITIFNNATIPFNGPMGGTLPQVTLNNGEFMMAWSPVNGWASTNGAADKFLISNAGAGTGTYDYYFIGTSV